MQQQQQSAGSVAAAPSWLRSEQGSRMLQSVASALLQAGVLVLGALAITYVVNSVGGSGSGNGDGGAGGGAGGSVDVASAERKLMEKLPRLYGGPPLQLTEYEAVIAESVVPASEVSTRFSDIGGLGDLVEEIQEQVVLPIRYPAAFASSSRLVGSLPSGLLLFGRPGTGKTLLARAVATECDAAFVEASPSRLLSKWLGDSNRLVAALFSLSRKIAPTVIFIDEIDCFLSERSDSSHEAMAQVKAEFMAHWDGLRTPGKGQEDGHAPPVMVMGATNRPFAVDEAILRRLSRSFEVPMPDQKARQHILRLLLRGERVIFAGDRGVSAVDPQAVDLQLLAERAEGYSGSDLKELCRCAAMVSVRELTRSLRLRMKRSTAAGEEEGPLPSEQEFAAAASGRRAMTWSDFEHALTAVRPGSEQADRFQVRRHLHIEERRRAAWEAEGLPAGQAEPAAAAAAGNGNGSSDLSVLGQGGPLSAAEELLLASLVVRRMSQQQT